MRKIADCQLFPSETNCSLTISGTEEEVARAAAEHAVSVHGHQDSAELREQVRSMLSDEEPSGRYGTVMIARLTGSSDDLRQALTGWIERGAAEGFLVEQMLLADDGTVVAAVFFASRQDYEALAQVPEQDAWWQREMSPLLSDVRWIDGAWQPSLFRAPALSS